MVFFSLRLLGTEIIFVLEYFLINSEVILDASAINNLLRQIPE